MDRFERYVAALSDEEALRLHRIVCRRASKIYAPLYRDKRRANQFSGHLAARAARERSV